MYTSVSFLMGTVTYITTSGQLQLKTLLLGIAVIQRNYKTSFGHRSNIIPGQSYIYTTTPGHSYI